jgi:hypothetical protein
MVFKDSVPTAMKTQRVTITKIKWLMLFRKIIAVYNENNMNPTNALWGQNEELLVKAGEICSYYCDLKGKAYLWNT